MLFDLLFFLFLSKISAKRILSKTASLGVALSLRIPLNRIGIDGYFDRNKLS